MSQKMVLDTDRPHTVGVPVLVHCTFYKICGYKDVQTKGHGNCFRESAEATK